MQQQTEHTNDPIYLYRSTLPPSLVMYHLRLSNVSPHFLISAKLLVATPSHLQPSMISKMLSIVFIIIESFLLALLV